MGKALSSQKGLPSVLLVVWWTCSGSWQSGLEIYEIRKGCDGAWNKAVSGYATQSGQEGRDL